jgi:CubicO group peptidase (beta-lactamase class C family)
MNALVVVENKKVVEQYFSEEYKKRFTMEVPKRIQADKIFNMEDSRFHPFLGSLHTAQSITKSILSLAVGIALNQKKIDSLEDGIENYLPKSLGVYFEEDPRKRDITIRDLLTMRSGLHWNEGGGWWASSDTGLLEQSDDWLAFVLGRKLVATPGTTWNYSDGDAVLLSGVLEGAVGMEASEFIQRELFEPLEIRRRDVYWKRSPQGLIDAQGGLYLSFVSILKVGYLVLNKGRWGHKRLITENYMREATETTNIETKNSAYRYGYMWWKDARDTSRCIAWGYGGQYLIIFPKEKMVALFLGWDIENQQPTPYQLIPQLLRNRGATK